MKFIFLFFVVFATAQCASIANEEDDAWNAFKAQYNKKYDTIIEEELRKQIFMDNKLMIDKHNQKYDAGKATFSVGINQFADLLHSEFMATHGGFKYTSPENLRGKKGGKGEKGATFVSLGDVPAAVNWTDRGAVTPVKDQGNCGSCWAFSSTGSLEGQVYIDTGNLTSLSEQDLVDCSTSNDGCNGGLMDLAFKDIRDMGGIDSEESYPYTGVQGDCKYNPANARATVSTWTFTEQYDEVKLVEAIANKGPISVGIDATYLFQFYQRGIFYDPTCGSDESDLNHAVLAAGYGVDIWTGLDYYIVKNSWGVDWGMDGYILMSRYMDNNCGIATYALYPTV